MTASDTFAKSQAILEATVKNWTDVVVAVMAIISFLVSIKSFFLSSRALRISEKQEERRQPKLAPRLLESYFQTVSGRGRIYSFRLSIANPTDSDNAVAGIEMHLSYLLDGGRTMTVKLPALPDAPTPTDERPRLLTPSRVSARDTVSGWCDFLVKPGILNGRAIEGYKVVLTDSQQAEASVDVHVVSERRHAH